MHPSAIPDELRTPVPGNDLLGQDRFVPPGCKLGKAVHIEANMTRE